MKLIEIFADKIVDLPLFEMAVERKMARSTIYNVSYTTVYHIVKLLIMPNAQYKEHWKREVNGYIRNIQNIVLKPKNKRLNTNQYYSWLVTEPEPRVDKMVEHARHDYKNDKFNIPTDLNETVQHILYRICTDLGNDQFISIDYYL